MTSMPPAIGRRPLPLRAAAKDTVNWLTGVQDEFGEKSKATLLGGLAVLLETIGAGIFVVGVLEAL